MSHDGWQYTNQSGRYSRDNRNGNSSNSRSYYNEPTPFSNNSSSYGRQYHRHNNGSRNRQPTSFSNNYHGQSHRYDSNNYKGDGASHGRGQWRGEGGGNRDTKKRDAPVVAYESTDDSSKKPKSHQNYHRNDLSTEQMKYRELAASQLQDGETIDCIPLQAFVHQDGWEERKTRAAEHAKECVLKELKKKADAESYNDDDGSGSEHTYVGNKQTPVTLSAMEISFFDSLPKCTMMMSGFDIDDKVKDSPKCCCPCSRQNAKWRKQNELDIDEDQVCDKFKPCEALGLMSHLKTKGGVNKEKVNRKKEITSMGCPFHYGTRMFLECLYKDYHGDIGHKALYQLNDENYKRAERAENRKKEREKIALKKEINQLQKEKTDQEKEMELLKKCNSELHDKVVRLKCEMEKLGVEQKPKLVMSDKEMKEYSDSIADYFASLLHIVDNGAQLKPVVKPVFYVEPDASGKCSYILQSFLDYLYDKKYKKGKKNRGKREDFDICHKLLFGTIPTRAELAEMKEQKKEGWEPLAIEMFDISIGLISRWDVKYNTTEQFEEEELKEATAIDEGGPSRQFLSDAWKQLHALFVYIILPQNLVIEEEVEEKKKTKKEEEEKKVKLFEEGESALIPIKDEQLEEKIHAYLSKKCKHKYEKDSPEIQAAYQNTVVRVKEYARAIGRLLLHSFLHSYPVANGVMAPFFLNMLLRGIGPSDTRYDRCDIVKHLDGVLGRSAEDNLLSYLLNEEREDGSGKWTKDAIFAEYIPDTFVTSRSIVMSGLIDGLSLNGNTEASNKLEEGSQLRNILRHVPLEAVMKILFARPATTFDDVKDAIKPVYGAGMSESEWEGTKEDFEICIREQKMYYEEIFLSFLKDQSEVDNDFLSKFVECCTGSCLLPYMPPGSDPYIKLEFNHGIPPNNWPQFYTCTKDALFPALCYENDCDEYQEHIMKAIEFQYNHFEMN